MCAHSSRNGRRQIARARGVSLVVAIVAALSGMLFSSVAFAHSGLGAASPGPGAIVGGDITQIELRYASTIGDPNGSVTDPNGDVIGSTFTQKSNLNVTISLDAALDVPGQYAVRHISTDVEDGDRVEAAYLFTYDPTAPPPQLEIIPDDDGFPWIWVIIGVGAVIIAVLAWRLLASMKRSRLAA